MVFVPRWRCLTIPVANDSLPGLSYATVGTGPSRTSISGSMAIGIDTVVSPRLSAIRAILQYIRKGKVVCVAPLKGEAAEVIEFEALETSDIVNTPLSEVKFPKEAIVGAIVRNEEIIIPRGHNMIKPHDHLIIFALKGAIPKLEKLFTVKLEYF